MQQLSHFSRPQAYLPGRRWIFPRFKPTELQRADVAAMAIASVPRPQIAAKLNISLRTLRKNFREELNLDTTARPLLQRLRPREPWEL